MQGPPTSAGDVPMLMTNRFSFTERFDHSPCLRRWRPTAISPGGEDHLHHAKKHQETTLLPGIFWVYELSAFMVEVSHSRVPFSHFLVRCCAIIGGVSSTAGFLDRFLHKADLGSLLSSAKKGSVL